MKFKITGDQTARSDTKSLCRSCVNSHIIEGMRPSQVVVRCVMNWNQPLDMTTWHVSRCNEYQDDSQAKLDAMEKIAWRVSADPKQKKVGFLSPAEWKAEQKKLDGDDL